MEHEFRFAQVKILFIFIPSLDHFLFDEAFHINQPTDRIIKFMFFSNLNICCNANSGLGLKHYNNDTTDTWTRKSNTRNMGIFERNVYYGLDFGNSDVFSTHIHEHT